MRTGMAAPVVLPQLQRAGSCIGGLRFELSHGQAWTP